MIKPDPWEDTTIVLSERKSRIAENAHWLWEIYCIAHRLNADDTDETFGISTNDKDKLIGAILQKRQFLGEIWDD